jgi:hypothetical protein
MQRFMSGNWQAPLRRCLLRNGSCGGARRARGVVGSKACELEREAFSGRESTALGQFALRNLRSKFHQKIDESADLER